MTGQRDTAAAMMRATGLIRAFIDDDSELVAAILAADEPGTGTTLGLIAVASSLAQWLARARDMSVEETLGETLRSRP